MFEYIYSWGKLLECLCQFFPSNIKKKKSILWDQTEGLFYTFNEGLIKNAVTAGEIWFETIF